ncbi:alpha/beta fold hydrolase [Crocosphaera sp.]|uniref:alpha/beta fold hydrolase n=1 Tax=Crocosphaera sp. TaxID=2729996 RepID=UPI003F276C28|nr:alpha/beta hydrolase [Crocosphaera sp.]
MNNSLSNIEAKPQEIQQETGLIKVRGVDHYYEWIRQPGMIKKPVMVFVHGWGGSARYWRSTAEALSDNYDCLLYDLRGFGRSKLPENPLGLSYELEEYAKDLKALLDGLGLDKVYMNSHSMGASVGALFSTMYPEKIERSILTCNGIFEYNKAAFDAFHKFGGYVVKFRYQWFLKVPFAPRLFMARFLHRSIDKLEKIAFLEDFILADYEAALGTIYTSVSKKAVETMPKKFAEISVPTLLISGEKDIIIPAAMGQEAAKLNDNIEYVEIAKTAHFPMLEDHETYLTKVREFLD